VRLFTNIDLQHAGVTGDPSTIAQTLRDLTLAALQATPVDGRIEMRLERSDGNARLSITDGRQAAAAPPAKAIARNGVEFAPGIDTPPDPLALRSMIERQGGRFSVEPPSSTAGMRYLIELPLHADDVEALPSRPAPRRQGAVQAPPNSLQGMSVMCIDDRSDALEALRMVLEVEGAQVLPFTTGRHAIAWLERNDNNAWPDVIVCDIALGDEDGHQVVRRIRQIEAERAMPLEHRVPAIALTGLAQPGDRVRALMAGFQVHLAKPVDAQKLVLTLYTLAGGAHAAPVPALPLERPT
jgi:ATP-binding cassette, subfamily B, bacterial